MVLLGELGAKLLKLHEARAIMSTAVFAEQRRIAEDAKAKT